ncbi:hypothetical protein GLOIN_2v1884347 [Rhizophagus irregularis DAOM 181602=DAOM 197198]|nr:hypothetical protein GLOIN_2v1884347 [Rhizophagus irregularis DAOM 181602=DAOM 197198]
MISPYNEVAELTFVLYVLNSLPLGSSVSFVSLFKFDILFSRWCEASPIRRARLKNNPLWSCISELLKSRRISCRFISFLKDSAPPYSIHAHELIKGQNWPNSLQPIPLMDAIFPSSLNTMGLFTGYDELLTQDPVKYWQSFSDIQQFFSLIGLSRFLFMQTFFHAVDWSLSFDTFKQTLYLNLAVSKSSIFAQFCLKL